MLKGGLYEYVDERNGKICKDQSEVDGTYGLAVYTRTEQEKLEDEDSTFVEPKFAQVHTDKPIDEWIVSRSCLKIGNVPNGERFFRQTRRFDAAILCVSQGKSTRYGGKRSAVWAC